MLKALPQKTNTLIFTGNNITVLPWNVFGDLNITSLRYIDMSNNQIQEIKGKSYHHVPNVETLILNHNNLQINGDGRENMHHPRMFSNFINLQSLHLTNAFKDNTDSELAEDLRDIFINSNLTKLYKLHLEQNEIKSFGDPNVFCDLPNIRDIYLSDNYLPALNFNVKCLKKLRFIDLEHNNITKLTQKDLDNLDKLAPPFREADPLMIDLSRNPLRCDAALKTFYNWLLKTNVTVRNKEKLECHSNKFGNKYVVNLKSLAENKQVKASNTMTVLLVVLTIALVSLIAGYIYIRKDKLKLKVGPFLDQVSRKIQYTTIESQPV